MFIYTYKLVGAFVIFFPIFCMKPPIETELKFKVSWWKNVESIQIDLKQRWELRNQQPVSWVV